LFKSTLVCPFCGTNIQHSREDERLTGSGLWKLKVAGLALLAPLVALIFNVDHLLVIMLIPASLTMAFAGHAAWEWIKHRNEPKGLSIR
jgi:hypothetical protein